MALRWPAVSKILYAALAVRFLFLFINNYIFYLPDGDMDAKSFERFAWENAQDGFLNNFNNYSGPGAYFFSFMLAIPYSLFGRSILLVQSLSIFFGIASVFLGWLLAKKIWDSSTAIKVGWSIALFPALVSYSVLTMREVYICFFLLLAIVALASFLARSNALRSGRDNRFVCRCILLISSSSLFSLTSFFSLLSLLLFLSDSNVETTLT